MVFRINSSKWVDGRVQGKLVKKEVPEAKEEVEEMLFSKFSRKDYVDNLRRILSMEIEGLLIEEKDTIVARDELADLHRIAELTVANQLKTVNLAVKELEELEAQLGKDSKEHLRQLDITVWVRKSLQTAQADASTKHEDYLAKESTVADIQKRLAMKKVQQQRLDAEFDLLQAGRSEKGIYPTPMIYPVIDEVVQKSDGPQLLSITACSFCDLPFPNSDIVVASCKHCYHHGVPKSFLAKAAGVSTQAVKQWCTQIGIAVLDGESRT